MKAYKKEFSVSDLKDLEKTVEVVVCPHCQEGDSSLEDEVCPYCGGRGRVCRVEVHGFYYSRIGGDK